MFAAFARSVSTTAKEGAITDRVVLAVGALVLVYGLYEFAMLLMEVSDIVLGDATGDVLEPTIRAFLALSVGFVLLVLAVTLEFTWDDGGH